MKRKNVKCALEEKNSIKIFVSYHKKYPIFCSKEIIPIHLGRSIAGLETKDGKISSKNKKWLLENLIGDNTGENISSENRKYCELTAQYWVWKHLDLISDAKYIGFMHYRRHFLFRNNVNIKNKKTWFNKSCVYCFSILNRLLFYKNLQSENIKETIGDYDCILLKPFNVKNIGYTTVKDRYSLCGVNNPKNFKVFETTVNKMYPQYSKSINEFIYGDNHILCNMFIMKKEIFEEYAEFLFKTLNEIDKNLDYSIVHNPEELRTLGYFGEYIHSLFIKINKERFKIKYIDGIYYDEPPITLDKIKKITRFLNLKIKDSI